MKIDLSVLDRVLLLHHIPRMIGDATTLRVLRDFEHDLGFTEEEHKLLNFRTDENGTHWDPGVEAKTLDIGPKCLECVKALLHRLDKTQQLTMDLLPTYDKFMGPKEQ